MNHNFKDITGQKFDRLTVISFSHLHEKKRNAVWNCICDCGNKLTAQGTFLRANLVRSCGCLQKEISRNRVPDNFEDLTGRKFGHLSVLNKAPKGKGNNTKWLCVCECGNQRVVDKGNLLSGRQISCGCASRKKARNNHLTHGLSKLPIYRVWSGMVTRCYNEKHDSYKWYGLRGIKMCDEWKNDFMQFYKDMNDGYRPNLELDRIDVNGNYCKENCRWATVKENQNNKRSNVYITFNGKTKTMKEWSEYYDVNYQSVHERRKMGITNPYHLIFGKPKYDKDKMLPK